MKQLLTNCRVFDGERVHKNRSVAVNGRHIAEILSAGSQGGNGDTLLDLGGNLLVPGFIDLQVNGGGGVLFNDAPTPATIAAIGAAHRARGTTGFLPTLISDTADKTEQAVAAASASIKSGVPGVLGVHLEGPHLNPGFCGIHDAARLRPLDAAALALLEGFGAGRMLTTLAPETVPAGSIRKLTDAGVLVFGGHSGASYEQTLRALDEGLCGFTHLFNAMTPLKSREPGMVGAALDDANSVFGIIADGLHVHPASLRLAIASKQPGKAILVTDAMPTLGAADKEFVLFGQTIRVDSGRLVNAAGTLAGAHLGMIDAVRNAARFGGVDIYEALRMASAYPARVLGLQDQLGAIRPGYRACLVELDESFNVVRSWIDGDMLEFPAANV
ncbi:MAG: N-acetylglucosamine-6-phosphate deacetylase [Pseudomonadota bacterium]